MTKKFSEVEVKIDEKRHEITDKSIRYVTNTRKKIDVVKALKMRLYQKMSYKDIAKYFNVATDSVYKALKPFVVFLDNPPELHDAYTQFEHVLLQLAKLKILEYLIRPDKLEKASVNNLAYAFAQLDHVYRLATNQPTENIDVKSLTVSLHELKKQRKELEVELSLVTKQIEEMSSDSEE